MSWAEVEGTYVVGDAAATTSVAGALPRVGGELREPGLVVAGAIAVLTNVVTVLPR
jgi:hypothetical protein